MTARNQQAGQSLNEEIHRLVFGGAVPTQDQMRERAWAVWSEQPEVQIFSDLGGFHVEPIDEAASKGPFRKGAARFVANVPDYSGSISGAWLVVEALLSDGWFMETESAADTHWVFLWQRYKRFDGVGRRDNTFPLAVCRATLSALEREGRGEDRGVSYVHHDPTPPAGPAVLDRAQGPADRGD